MSEFPKPTKRLARPKAASSIDPSLDVILKDIYRIVRTEVDRMTIQANQKPLSESETRILHGHAKLLLDVQKEQRIAEKEDRDKAEKLTDDELKQYAKQLLKDDK